ncbi:MAG TPA: hypothetical protein VNX65_04325 [Patescibacteria group bacterium]|jgi:hypothetical protein|nr:hypothetical protein [Patescibacteria group bacterium]
MISSRTIWQPINVARDLATKKVIKQLAHKFRFVYFGRVSQEEARYQLLRGATSSIKHSDNHYTVGSFRGYDVTLVERRDELVFPGKTPRDYHWLIMQFDLKRVTLPHIFIEGNHHDEVFFANLLVKHAQLHNANNLFEQTDKFFTQNFKVFIAAHIFSYIHNIITPEITSMIAHHFAQFDYELEEDRLLIYATNPKVITLNLAEEMMRVGIWLAERLDSAPQDDTSPHRTILNP